MIPVEIPNRIQRVWGKVIGVEENRHTMVEKQEAKFRVQFGKSDMVQKNCEEPPTEVSSVGRRVLICISFT